ncbi:MAG: hypothetical protein AB7S50_09635 [Bacteroidales bacterium]
MYSIKRFSLTLIVLVGLTAFRTHAQENNDQEFKPSGKFKGNVFSNFHMQLNSPELESAFEVQRAYFGYTYQMSENFTAILKLDIGSPNQTSQYDLLKRYAYFKNAGLVYHKNKLTLSFGLIDLFQFKVQERFWNHRYIYQSFQDLYKFGNSADLGFSAEYKMNDFLSGDFSVMNGEGYNQLQTDNAYKSALGISVFPLKNLTIRLYADYMEKDEIQTTWSSFVAYDFNHKASIGIEYNIKLNYNYTIDQNLSGISMYASYEISKMVQLFGRFDKLWSNKISGEPYQWNINKDGSAIIGGVQVTPIKNILIAINYQDWVPYANNIENEYYLYCNLEFKF